MFNKFKFLLSWLLFFAIYSPSYAQVTSALVDNAVLSSSTGTTATITGATFGSAFSGRVIIVPYLANSTGFDAATEVINSVSATLVNNTGNGVGFGYAVVPSGTSGNVAFTFIGGGSDRVAAGGVYALTGAAGTVSATIVNGVGGTGIINVPAGGSVFAYSLSNTGAGTWIGATALFTGTDPFTGLIISCATFDNSGGALTARPISYSTGALLTAAAFDAGTPPPSNGGTYRSLTGVGK